ncbi:hypothetical protein K2V49_04030 [Staphylococcus gallinarum]|uniref:hypothetical protein n=1 Tax=Staphylococcus gallinarum TaxID=1293 RepID=UPI001E57C384|nr:hypothetical protein [Staphylococcus gallinarum]MCD8899433.1 hypothetical protein [Staphylococcus gallinarum]
MNQVVYKGVVIIQYTKKLLGKWYIVASTFNMWTSGKKINPSITYSLLELQPLKILDEVAYLTRNKSKSILGYDTLDNDQFIWRGKGVLRLFSSKWKIIYIDDDVLVIKFTSTLVTPSGMDILFRNKQKVNSYKEKIESNPEFFNIKKEVLKKFQWL